MKHHILPLICALFLTQFTSAAQVYGPTTDFKANWVVADELPDPIPANLWFVFRKSFDLEDVPVQASARIACDSKYWLYVNGKMVVFEGQLKRGPTPQDTYFDVVDLAPSLQKGKNTVAVLMWYFGKDGFSHKNSGKPGFLFDLQTDGLELLSDASWKGMIYSNLGSFPPRNPQTGKQDSVWREMGIGPFEIQTADPQPNYRLPESNIRYDARFALPENWTTTAFDDTTWKNVKPVGKPPVAPWNQLYARPIPLWKDFGLKNYVNADDIPAVSTELSIHCKLPYNAQVTPYLKVDAPEGLTIDMRTDNYLGGSEYNVRSEYITRSGVQEFESPGWMNGHEIIYTMSAGVKILELKYRETGFDTEFAGSFECDDPFYNKLWEKAVRTLYVTMRDTYFDCPDRERAQWWGDAVNELGEAFYALDVKSALLAKKGIYELMRWQRPDGTIHSPVPGVFDAELPMQMLASIGWYGFRTWCFYADDFSPVVDVYPNIKKYLDVWQFGDDGLILHRTGGWDWGDWGENIDLRILANCWYYLAAQAAAEYALKTGQHDGDADHFRAQMKTIRENFDKVFWTGTEYRNPKYTGKTDDRSNAMAVVAGLAKPENYPAIRKVLLEQKHASPYMEKYVLEALCLMGYHEDALVRMKERFTKMVEHPEYTTLWEGWGIGAEGFGGGTINHAWSGGGLTILAQYITGVKPTSPGFTTFSVAPNMGSLRQIRSSTPTKYGNINVELNRTDDSLTMKLTVPKGTTAKVVIPKGYSGVTSSGPISELPAGTWTIEAKR
ncbi:MAG: hypothetical protein FWC43_04530 [Planctomycetaceae bacterium]|nr:hypothetical protein [Planctomycetaceae bacterium]